MVHYPSPCICDSASLFYKINHMAVNKFLNFSPFFKMREREAETESVCIPRCRDHRRTSDFVLLQESSIMFLTGCSLVIGLVCQLGEALGSFFCLPALRSEVCASTPRFCPWVWGTERKFPCPCGKHFIDSAISAVPSAFSEQHSSVSPVLC